MPKVTYEFNLPEEQYEFAMYSKAKEMQSVLWDFSEDVLRKMDKYGMIDNRELSGQERHIVSHIRERFYGILNEYGIDL